MTRVYYVQLRLKDNTAQEVDDELDESSSTNSNDLRPQLLLPQPIHDIIRHLLAHIYP
jgi:hypothetical protein